MTIKNFFICLFVVFMFAGCKKEGPTGKKSLLNMVAEPSGANCSTGGTKITTGIDLNDNNILDENEIQNSKYICNGSNGNNGNNGNNSLINNVFEPASLNCPNGGYLITSGIDLNGNNILDNNEIQNSEYLCNGSSGTTGISQINLNLFRNLCTGGSPINNIYYGNIIGFNKTNYLTIDSVKLAISYVFTGDPNTGVQAVKNISVELIDVTNNLAIANSKIITDDILLGQTKYSVNLNNNLPNSNVNLGVFIRAEDDCYFTIGSVDLIIWRH